MNNSPIAALELVHCTVTANTTWSFIRLARADGASGWGEASWVREPGALDACHAVARQHLLGQPWAALAAYIARDTRGVPQAAGFNRIKIAPFDGLTPDTLRTPPGRRLIDLGLARVAAGAYDVFMPDVNMYGA